MRLPITQTEKFFDDINSSVSFPSLVEFKQKFWNKFFEEQFWRPKTDISETDSELTIDMNIPGVKKENIKIELEENRITISGTYEEKKENLEKKWYRSEREYGKFERTFEVPYSFDQKNIHATTKDGILHITLQKQKISPPEKKQISLE